jgi:hypothetical protein
MMNEAFGLRGSSGGGSGTIMPGLYISEDPGTIPNKGPIAILSGTWLLTGATVIPPDYDTYTPTIWAVGIGYAVIPADGHYDLSGLFNHMPDWAGAPPFNNNDITIAVVEVRNSKVICGNSTSVFGQEEIVVNCAMHGVPLSKNDQIALYFVNNSGITLTSSPTNYMEAALSVQRRR